MTVELILIKPDLSNDIGWVIEEPGDKDSYRELDRKTFVVPEGFELAETTMGDSAFFDRDGYLAEICTNPKTKCPFLCDDNGKNYFKPADLVHSEIKELRKEAGLTQQEFADYFRIPRRTVENWEVKRTEPAKYLVELMEYKLRREGIIR